MSYLLDLILVLYNFVKSQFDNSNYNCINRFINALACVLDTYICIPNATKLPIMGSQLAYSNTFVVIAIHMHKLCILSIPNMCWR